MPVKKDQVFLISGNMLEAVGPSDTRLGTECVQRVVIAEDARAAYGLLAEQDAKFVPLGHASLQDFETNAAKLRAILKGESTEWHMLIAPGMNI